MYRFMGLHTQIVLECTAIANAFHYRSFALTLCAILKIKEMANTQLINVRNAVQMMSLFVASVRPFQCHLTSAVI